MKYIILFGLLLLVSNVAAEEVQLGPYLVSFDLEDVEYDVVNPLTTEGETYDGAVFLNHVIPLSANGNLIMTVIQEFPVSRACDFGTWWKVYDADSAYMRDIDGKHTVLMIENQWYGDTAYHTAYFLEGLGWIDGDGEFSADRYGDGDAKMTGQSLVCVTSYADWDITRQFLNTLHVEKIE